MVANDAEIAQAIAQWTIVVTTPIGAGLGWWQVGPPIRQHGAPIPALIDAEQSQQEHDYNDDEQQAYKVVRGAATTAQRASIIAAATAYQQNDDNYKQYCHRWTASVDASVNIAALLCSERQAVKLTAATPVLPQPVLPQFACRRGARISTGIDTRSLEPRSQRGRGLDDGETMFEHSRSGPGWGDGSVDMACLSIIGRWHKREHVPIREVSRRLGVTWNTIRQYLRSDLLVPKS